MSAEPFADPQLTPFVEEQRRINAQLGTRPPPPDPTALRLPAKDVQLPGAGAPCCRIIDAVDGDGRPAAARGVFLHLHGGGFKHGSAAMADAANSALARALGVATVSIEYRLAPAHTHPAAVDDCIAAALWLLETARTRFGTERLLIGGDSVGATLAVLTLLRLRDGHGAGGRFHGASLVAGNYDLSMTPSQRHSTDALFLSPAHLLETRTAQFPGLEGESLRAPSISPLYADLSGLPPAVFTVGSQDAVLDDSLFMAARWRAAGNAAQLDVYPQATHVFMAVPSAMARAARARIERFLEHCLAH